MSSRASVVACALACACATATTAREDAPPKLVVYAPEDGTTIEPTSKLRGYVDDDWDDPASIEVSLEVVGGVVSEVRVDTEGTFESDLVLGDGPQQVLVTATDSNDGATTVSRSVTVSAAGGS